MNRLAPNGALELAEIPVSDRTFSIGADFMLSDNLDSSAPLEVLNFDSSLQVKISAPFKLRFSIILFFLHGSMDIRLNMIEYAVGHNDMLIVPEGTIGECLRISDDSRIVMMAFSKDFVTNDAGIRTATGAFATVIKKPMIHLCEGEAVDIMSLFDMLRRRLSEDSFTEKRKLVYLCMQTMYCYVSSHFREVGSESKNEAGAVRLFNRFIELVEAHHAGERLVKYYSDRLAVSQKYLSRAVLEVSGRTAKSWIMERIILEARVLLREDRLSVLEISEQLGFPNQSFFGTYFKNATGLSPNAYRKAVL